MDQISFRSNEEITIDDGYEDMKADRLTRKTHLKKISSRLSCEHITHYDLTCETEQGFSQSLSDIHVSGCASVEDIAALPSYFETDDDILAWCAGVISDSPTGNALWQNATACGWSVGISDLDETGYALNTEEKRVLLDHFGLSPDALGRSPYFRNALLTVFVRALRDIWHEEEGHIFEADYAPDQALMLERVKAADCDAVTILTSWELRGAGYADIWRHVIGSEEGDMAMIFTRFLERDPTALYDGSALSQAFRQWYADEGRVDGCDHETLEILDEILGAAERRNPFGQLAAEGALLEKMTALPDGACYLNGLGDKILQDPFFAGLSDPINQTHLFHLIYDTEVKMVNNVPFRDGGLARKIFPEGEITKVFR